MFRDSKFKIMAVDTAVDNYSDCVIAIHPQVVYIKHIHAPASRKARWGFWVFVATISSNGNDTTHRRREF